MINLNDLKVNTDSDYTFEPPRKNAESPSYVEVLFSDLENELVKRIKHCSVVVGCLAWLTNSAVLSALAHKHAVSIIVQKEDFLRPDASGWSKSKQHKSYLDIPGFNHYEAASGLNTNSNSDASAIRCCGISKRNAQVMPRMHHKFLVFCDRVARYSDRGVANYYYQPVMVWTGSFNPTSNGTLSLENAVVIHSPVIANAYYNEWLHVLGLSEPLDWTSEYVAPEYRLGT